MVMTCPVKCIAIVCILLICDTAKRGVVMWAVGMSTVLVCRACRVEECSEL